MKKAPPTRLKMVSFRIDEETDRVLDRLTRAVEDSSPDVAINNYRSMAIRRALLEAGERLLRSSKK